MSGLFTKQALRRLVVPLFLDQILLMTVGILGTLMVSHAGEAAVSAMSMVDMINLLIFNLFAALDTGGAVVVSQYLGRKDSSGAHRGAGQLLAITVLIALVVLLLVVFFHGPVLQLLFGQVDPTVMAASQGYFLISALSYPFLAVYNSGGALFRSMGQSRVPVLVSLLMNVLGTGGIAAVVFGWQGGIEGVAWALFAARGVGALVMLVLVSRRANLVSVRMRNLFAWDRPMIGRILRIAVPSGIENSLYQLGRILVISMIALLGTTQIAANGITQTLVMVAISYASAMNLAIVTVVGHCVGARDYERAVAHTKALVKQTYLVTAALSVAEVLALPLLLTAYAISPETSRLTFLLVVIHNGLALVLWPLSFTVANALRAAGDVRFTMVTALVSMFGFRIVFAWVLGIALGLGVVGVWLAMGLDWTFRAVVFFLRFQGGRWKSIAVI